jgi:hypothetical protein
MDTPSVLLGVDPQKIRSCWFSNAQMGKKGAVSIFSVR